MKIAIIASPFVPVPPLAYGGTERVICYLIQGLRELGHTPILLGPGDSTVDCRIIPIVDKAIYFPQKKSDIPAFLQRVRRLNKVTERKLKELIPSIDIIHSHSFDLSYFSHVPHLTTLHSPINLEDIGYYQRRRHEPFVTVSRNQQEAFPALQYRGVVYNGEDPAAFPIVLQPEEYLCFLGRFDREKNPHLAIQLAIQLGMKIKLAGKTDFQAEGYFAEEIEPYLTHPLVEYLGELNFTEKVTLISNAKCNLHPTGFREPFGLDVLEAAYCGTPTLSISKGAMPELIEEGRTGILVEDYVEGFTKIQACFAMDRRYIAMRARSLFNYRRMTKEYVALYQQVINSFQLVTGEKSVSP